MYRPQKWGPVPAAVSAAHKGRGRSGQARRAGRRGLARPGREPTSNGERAAGSAGRLRGGQRGDRGGRAARAPTGRGPSSGGAWWLGARWPRGLACRRTCATPAPTGSTARSSSAARASTLPHRVRTGGPGPCRRMTETRQWPLRRCRRPRLRSHRRPTAMRSTICRRSSTPASSPCRWSSAAARPRPGSPTWRGSPRPIASWTSDAGPGRPSGWPRDAASGRPASTPTRPCSASGGGSHPSCAAGT